MFTLSSVTQQVKEVKPEVQVAIDQILELMRKYQIVEVKL
jgi:hypothetical protein